MEYCLHARRIHNTIKSEKIRVNKMGQNLVLVLPCNRDVTVNLEKERKKKREQKEKKDDEWTVNKAANY